MKNLLKGIPRKVLGTSEKQAFEAPLGGKRYKVDNAIGFGSIYLLDSSIHPLNNRAQPIRTLSCFRIHQKAGLPLLRCHVMASFPANHHPLASLSATSNGLHSKGMVDDFLYY